jgi:sister-chromatid-cohesion protein PDS5
MYAAEKSGPELVRKYPATWATWLGRKADISVPVRLKCVESVPPLLANLPEAREALEGKYAGCFTGWG